MRLILFCLFFSFVGFSQQDDSVRLNDIRILASHNSYKKQPDPRVLRFVSKFKKQLGPSNDPEQIEYGHLPLPVQLDSFNIRGFELDIYYDPKGKRYYKRRVNGFARGVKKRSKLPELKSPGFKMIHITDVDYETNYTTLDSALVELSQWSTTHREHVPIFVNIEAKGTGIGDASWVLRLFGFKKAVPFDSAAYASLDTTIRHYFASDQLLTQEELKGDYSSVQERLETKGWPLLSECKGKVVFILEGVNSDIYRQSLKNGEDRAMFTYSEPGESYTAFIVRNQPKEHELEIDELSETYIVRTRSDAGTFESRNNDYSRLESAIKSNAQIISTDYYCPNPKFSSYCVQFSEIYLLRQ